MDDQLEVPEALLPDYSREESIDDTLVRLVGGAQSPPLYRRAWVLALFHASESFGVTPIEQRDAHSLVFLANALAPVYELLAPDRSVLKSASGPFFPTVQWDLDRLCAQGLLDFTTESSTARVGSLSYSCSPIGQRLVLSELSGSPLVQLTIGFLQEVVSAFASAGSGASAEIASADATYAAPAPIGAVLDFGEWDSASDFNYSLRTTQAFDTASVRGLPFSPRERIHLYLRYLRIARSAPAA